VNFARAFANPYLSLTIAPLLWGGNAVAGKLATHDWLPHTLVAARWFAATLLLLLLSLPYLRGEWGTIKANWKLLFALGAGMCTFNIFMYTALNHTSAINVSIEQAAMPIIILMANFLLFSQRSSALQIIGLLLSVVGVLVTTTAGHPLSFFTSGMNIGDAYMLFGVCFYSAYTIGLRWKPKLHWLVFMLVIAISASIVSVPVAIVENTRHTFTMPSFEGWIVLAYIVICPSIISQICFARGVELIGGNRAAPFINLVPIFGSLLAILILREQLHWYHVVGLALVIGGIWLAEKFAVK